MLKEKNKWIAISLINLAIVALLGTVLRSKILFSIPWIDFKYLLHAHSHFAFGGWLTLCLFTLMTFEILPAHLSSKRVYKILLSGTLLSAVGMLLSFPLQGYGLFSILFSTLLILVTYAYSWIFIRDLLKCKADQAIRLLCIVSLIAADLSSVGPITLAYVMASHSANSLLYRDAIYTYLHLQYNGFFTLGVFALFFHQLNKNLDDTARHDIKRFALLLTLSVLPTLFLSYLWHSTNLMMRYIAFSGCFLLVIIMIQFIITIRALRNALRTAFPFTKSIGALSMFAFLIKTTLQIGIVFPKVGDAVFGDRPIIIAYLHLVMLGFVTLYLMAHLLHMGYFEKKGTHAKIGIIIFTAAVVGNEIILMTQGLSVMLMKSSPLYPWLLWAAAIFLLIGSALISISAIRPDRRWRVPQWGNTKKTTQIFHNINSKTYEPAINIGRNENRTTSETSYHL